MENAKNNNDLILIAKITGTHGVKGYVKIYTLTENIDNLFIYNTYLSKEAPIKLEKKFISSGTNSAVCKIENVNTKEEAEKLKNTNIYIKSSNLEPLSQDEFYLFELINAEVLSNNEVIGKVIGAQFHKLIKNSILEIEIFNKNIIHLAEFTKNNFLNSDDIKKGDKIKLHINSSSIEYLKYL